jgi:predicted metal-binding protein
MKDRMEVINMAQRMVNVLMSKQLRIVVVCQSCPIDPSTLGQNQKTACIHLKKALSRKQRRHPELLTEEQKKQTPLVKEQQCEWYKNDSLKKLDNDVNIIECTKEV